VLFLVYLGQTTLALIIGVLLIVILSLVLLLVIRETFRVFKGNAPYVPSAKKLINKILAEIDFKENSLVYELGCGDARFLRALVAKKNVQAIGYEYFIIPFLAARLYNFFQGKKVKVYYKDFFKANLSDADYLFCFLLSKEMEHLEEKLQQELKSGAMVISNTFQFKNWQPEKIIVLDNNKKAGLNNKIYIYRK
jgi:hypothetical protein